MTQVVNQNVNQDVNQHVSQNANQSTVQRVQQAAMHFIVLIGVQGAGKGTQADILTRVYGLPNVSTGVLFRKLKTEDSDFARAITATLLAGKLVDDATTVEIVQRRLAQPDATKGVIFDGFPRTTAQADALALMAGEKSGSVSAVYLNLPRETALHRIVGRRISPVDENEIYHITDNPPAVEGKDKAGNDLIIRKDDTPEAAGKRIAEFFELTMPLLEYYRSRDLLIEIDALQPIPKVTEQLVVALNRVLVK